MSETPFSSCCSSAPVWGPSHRVQSFVNCSNVGSSHEHQFFKNYSRMVPFHRKQSFRNRLLQCGSFTGHRSCQKTCSRMGFSQAAASFRAHAPAQSSTGCRVDVCSTMLVHGLRGDNLQGHLNGLQDTLCSSTWSTYFSPFFTDLVVCKDVSP